MREALLYHFRQDCADSAMQVLGGNGYVGEYQVCRERENYLLTTYWSESTL